MKTVYFVRHGQSEGNIGPIHHSKATPLTLGGIKQADAISKRAVKLDAEVVISSAMTRSRQTADVIANRLGKQIIFCELFEERKSPKEQTGTRRDSPEAVRAGKEILKNFTRPGYRFSDEENFDELKIRAAQALKYLEGRPESNILVVTHGLFMRVLVSYLILGEELNASECDRFMGRLYMENTGITVFCYDESAERSKWKLIVWNDYAHLG